MTKAPKKRSNGKSSLENFIRTMNFTQVVRKSFPIYGRRVYDYPIMDHKGFFRLFGVMNKLVKKTYMPEKGTIVKIVCKMKMYEQAILILAIYDKSNEPTSMYIQEVKVVNGKNEGMLKVSLAMDATEADLEKLKKEVLRFFPEKIEGIVNERIVAEGKEE